MVSKNIIIILLVTALVLSASATYITITKFDEAFTPGSNTVSVGLFVKPAREANVGLFVLPPEEEENK
ncbi:MAG: hypothetical protein L6408_02490 [Nanoarchaeota archaeon]|nr:hypothetical protein [Nanoarchaeota archaeon]